MILNNLSPTGPETRMTGLLYSNPYLMILLEHLDMSPVVGEDSVAELCQRQGIPTGLFLYFIRRFTREPDAGQYHPSVHDIPLIVKYLKNSHQYYINEKYPEILGYIREIHTINPDQGVHLLEDFFHEYMREVRVHLDYENDVVFPYTLSLFEVLAGHQTHLSPASYSVHDYQEHHSDIEEKLTDLKNLLVKYLPENKDAVIRRKLLFSLFELEYDLAIHSDIEEHVLIPLVEGLEQNYRERNV